VCALRIFADVVYDKDDRQTSLAIDYTDGNLMRSPEILQKTQEKFAV
jgi:hypothetical protein